MKRVQVTVGGTYLTKINRSWERVVVLGTAESASGKLFFRVRREGQGAAGREFHRTAAKLQPAPARRARPAIDYTTVSDRELDLLEQYAKEPGVRAAALAEIERRGSEPQIPGEPRVTP